MTGIIHFLEENHYLSRSKWTSLFTNTNSDGSTNSPGSANSIDPIASGEIGKLMVKVQKKYNAASIIISHDVNCIKITANA